MFIKKIILVLCFLFIAGKANSEEVTLTSIIPEASEYINRGCNYLKEDLNDITFRKVFLEATGKPAPYGAHEFCYERANREAFWYSKINFDLMVDPSKKSVFSGDCVPSLFKLSELNNPKITVKEWNLRLAEIIARMNAATISLHVSKYPLNPTGATNILRQLTDFNSISNYIESVCETGKYFAIEGYKKRQK